MPALDLMRTEPFVKLPYLATLGFKVTLPLTRLFQCLARVG